MDCLFCKIVRKEIPSTVVAEDEGAIAFMDIMPARKGHVLIVPKHHAENIFELPEEHLLHAMRLVKRVALAVRDAVPQPGFSVVQLNGEASGQTVFHYHVHVIPRKGGDGIKMKWSRESYGKGEIEQYRDKIKAALQ